MTFTPLPFQRADLDRLKRHNYTALFNIQTGGGKTPLATFAIKESGAAVTLIVAPAQTMSSAWVPTVTSICGTPPREIGNSNKAKQAALADFEMGYPGVYMVTPQLFARGETKKSKGTDISLWEGDMLILDEAHESMSPGSRGERRMAGLTPFESEKSLARRFPMRLALSGTAFRNRFEYAWSYGRLLWWWLDKREEIAYSNHWVWKQDRMTSDFVYRKDAEGKPVKVTNFLKERETGAWINQAPCVITHLKRERCCDFHPNGFMSTEEPTVLHETISLLPAQKKAIDELEQLAVTWLGEHPMVTEIPLTRDQRIRQVILGVPTLIPVDDGDGYTVDFADDCESPFLDKLITRLQWEEEDEPYVVWTDSQRFARVAALRLNKAGITAFEYSGATRKTRDQDLKLFGSRYRVMIGVIAAGGTGLDSIQHICNNEIWLSESLDSTLNEQGRGRTDRMGQSKQVMRTYYHDNLGISQGRHGTALAKQLELNKSLRSAA